VRSSFLAGSILFLGNQIAWGHSKVVVAGFSLRKAEAQAKPATTNTRRIWVNPSATKDIGMLNDSDESFDESLVSQPDAELVDAVVAELDRMRDQKSSWWNALIVLIISMMLFAGADASGGWKSLAILVNVLLFHELGHFLTMRFFGYRNLKMFFIPFFGAAVSGKHYNVQGWKKAVVALMGPLPGIALGTVAGIAGVVLRQPLLVDIALPLVLLNGSNLLPLMPFDGGWVLHAVLFCRHPLLDLAFRLVTVAALAGLGIFTGSIFFWVIAVFTALAIPSAWRVANAAHRLRAGDAVAASLDDDTVPPETVRVILSELQKNNAPSSSVTILAQQVASVFETLNARPPGALASAGLLAVHVGAFLWSAVLTIVLFFVQAETKKQQLEGVAVRAHSSMAIPPRVD
jgi:Zn-dependent protease